MEVSPSDLSDEQCPLLEPLIPPQKPGGRPPQVDMPAVLHALFSLLPAGRPWRMLPRESPPRLSVYEYCALFGETGIWEQIMPPLRQRGRVQAGRAAPPSAGLSESPAVKTTDRGGPHGSDGGKKLSGRKRHMLGATTGLLLKVVVHEATIQDRQAVPLLLSPLKGLCPP